MVDLVFIYFLNKIITLVYFKLAKRAEPIPESLGLDEFEEDLFIKRKSNCTIFLGYTSNMCSSGIRDTIKFLVQNKLVDCIVTTAGGVEEDFIKCLAPTFVGNFELKGSTLRESGINRIGNLVIPNDNYCKFEDWVMPLLDEMVTEQKEKGTKWTPSRIIEKLGRAINNPESVYYWAAVNNIPVFSPALTDGSLGDMMYFHSYKNPGLVVDILEDLKRLNTMAVKASNSGMVILGGGLIKHHICNANLMVIENTAIITYKLLKMLNYFRGTEQISLFLSTQLAILTEVTVEPSRMKLCHGVKLRKMQPQSR